MSFCGFKEFEENVRQVLNSKVYEKSLVKNEILE